jgi:energy-coupling factor transporter ATP-binding protein EcfA2
MLAVFAEVQAFENVRYILLDEWDANLDSENIGRLDAAIDRLAEKWTVIESRHRA